MPILPSGGARWVDANGRGQPAVRPLIIRQTSPGVYGLATTGAAEVELVETSPGVFESVAVGTAPSARRLVVRQVNGGPALVY